MTKQYLTQAKKLSADNGMEIYYDKKYDTTDYGLLIQEKRASRQHEVEKFSAEHTRMTPDEFFDLIREKVVATQVPNGTPDIDYLTETSDKGKKKGSRGRLCNAI